MKQLPTIIGVIILGSIAYYLFFPKDSFITFGMKYIGEITFWETGISYTKPPDHFPKNGLEHIATYISKLNIPSSNFKSLIIMSSETETGLSLYSRDGQVKISFLLDWRKEPEEEKSIRDYFTKLGISPSSDYLAGNGDVPDATREISYNLVGNDYQITDLVKDVLKNLYGITNEEALDIRFKET